MVAEPSQQRIRAYLSINFQVQQNSNFANRTLTAMIEGGRGPQFYHQRPGLAEFRKEVTSFPNGKFDDFVDLHDASSKI